MAFLEAANLPARIHHSHPDHGVRQRFADVARAVRGRLQPTDKGDGRCQRVLGQVREATVAARGAVGPVRELAREDARCGRYDGGLGNGD